MPWGPIAVVVFTIVTAVAGRASAADVGTKCPAPADSSPGLADVDAMSRLAFIRSTLDDQARRSQTWKWAWMAAGSSLVAANFLNAARTASHTDRADSIVGGTGSLLIPLSMFIQPPLVLRDRAEVERKLAESADRCAALARAEALLARDAESQTRTTSVRTQIASVGSNVAVALVMGLGFGHWKGAAWAGGAGTLISEAYIVTRPRGAIGAWRRYRNGEVSSPDISPRWSVVPLASRSRMGVHVQADF